MFNYFIIKIDVFFHSQFPFYTDIYILYVWWNQKARGQNFDKIPYWVPHQFFTAAIEVIPENWYKIK